jgi:hypothetical protein
MENIETLLQKFPGLTTEEKLEAINNQWLFENAPERSRERALARLDALLACGVCADTRMVMTTIRDVAKDLQNAIEERIASVRLTGS